MLFHFKILKEIPCQIGQGRRQISRTALNSIFYVAKHQSSVKNSVRSQTSIGITNSGNKSLRHTLAGHQLSSLPSSESTRFDIKNKVLQLFIFNTPIIFI